MNAGILTSGHRSPPMPYGLLGRPTPVPMPDQYWHPEATDWGRRVIANGGSVSRTTMAAVSEFCNAIDAAGIRDRFFRLNLFAGTGLAACLVPLYRGPSRADTQFGNAIETNSGPFVSGDYVETGARRGLQGSNPSSKHLNTGLTPATVGFPFHMSCYLSQFTAPTINRCHLGASSAVNVNVSSLWWWITASRFVAGATGGEYLQNTDAAPSKFLLGSMDGASAIFVTDTNNISGSLPSYALSTANWVVLSESRGGTVSTLIASNARISAYSLGRGMNIAQAKSLQSALVTFQSALGLT